MWQHALGNMPIDRNQAGSYKKQLSTCHSDLSGPAMAYQLLDPLPDLPQTAREQNYDRWFMHDVGGVAGHDQTLYLHPNGLCLISLAPTHAALQPSLAGPPDADAAPAAIDFNVGRNNLLHAEYRKGRGPLLNPDAALCRLTVGGKAYLVRSLVRGLLVDVNEQLAEAGGPELLRLLRDSYVAIVDLKQGEAQRLQREGLSPVHYAELRGVPLTALQ